MSYSRVGVLLLVAQVGCAPASSDALTSKLHGGSSGGGADGSSNSDVDASADPYSDHDAGSTSTSDATTSHDGSTADDSSTPDDAATPDDASAPDDAATPDDSSINAVDSALPPADSGSDGCTVGCGVVDASTGVDSSVPPHDAGPPNPSLVLSTLAANQAGRTGDDLVLSVQGSDTTLSAFALDITLYDVFNHPLAAFKPWSGASAQRTVLFDNQSAAGLSSFARTVTLRGFMKSYPNITSVSAALVDAAGHSNAITTSVVHQTVRNLNQSCDVNVIANRCSTGLSCDGSSHTCVNPSAPHLSQFLYVTSSTGGRVLFAGSDPADDLSTIHLEFLTSGGQPVLIDVNGDGNLKSSFDEPVIGASKLGAFFYSFQSTPTFSAVVTQLGATPSGTTSGTGARMTALLQAPPVAATGGACDVRGFASCQPGDACIRSQATQPAGTCAHIANALDSATTAAPTLDTSHASLVTGYATGTNLWGDAPSDCVPSGLVGMPEGIAILHVPQPLQTLTITTDNQVTTYSSKMALFVLSGKGSAVGSESLGCNYGAPATVTLSNVAAGDYTLVINSATPGDGNFGITVQ